MIILCRASSAWLREDANCGSLNFYFTSDVVSLSHLSIFDHFLLSLSLGVLTITKVGVCIFRYSQFSVLQQVLSTLCSSIIWRQQVLNVQTIVCLLKTVVDDVFCVTYECKLSPILTYLTANCPLSDSNVHIKLHFINIRT